MYISMLMKFILCTSCFDASTYAKQVMSNMSGSCHLWVSRVSYMSVSCHMWVNHVTYEWVLSHMMQSWRERTCKAMSCYICERSTGRSCSPANKEWHAVRHVVFEKQYHIEPSHSVPRAQEIGEKQFQLPECFGSNHRSPLSVVIQWD